MRQGARVGGLPVRAERSKIEDMTPPLLAVRLRNQLRKINPALEVELKNININGRKVGCSGYVTDPRTGRVIYVDTEALLLPTLGGAMWRAVAVKGQSHARGSSRNYFSEEERLARDIVEAFKTLRDNAWGNG